MYIYIYIYIYMNGDGILHNIPRFIVRNALILFENDLFTYFLFWGHCAGFLMLHGLSLVSVHRLLTMVASAVAKHGL